MRLLLRGPLPALQFALDGFADEVKAILAFLQRGIDTLGHAFRQRQNNPLVPEFGAPHAACGAMHMKFRQSR